ncbi:MAG: sigma 54-interacting transcriptional regulator [Pseudomonadota bacterium]
MTHTLTTDLAVAGWVLAIGIAIWSFRRLRHPGKSARNSSAHTVGVPPGPTLPAARGERVARQPSSPDRDYKEVLARVSSRLLTTAHERLHEAIRSSLRDVCQYVRVDRAAIVWFIDETKSIEVLYYWIERGTAPTARFQQGAFEWMMPQLMRGESITVDSTEQLPDDADTDYKSLREMGIDAAMVTPMVQDGEVLGAISLTMATGPRTWSETYVSALKVLAACFGSAISKLRAQQRLDDLTTELESARDRLQAENVYLQQEIRSSHGFAEIVGESEALRACLAKVSQVAATDLPVLIQGETGTGKELIGRAVHEGSSRRDHPLVKVNCAALPASLIESELFGHEQGAFTGAAGLKPGRFELADGGTLFLDEIGEIPIELQAKLLRVLQDGEYQRVGGTKSLHTDVRIIAATNRPLELAIANGTFRSDLYYRINTFLLEVPPLRERTGDIPLLAQHFVTKHAKRQGKAISSISRGFLDELEASVWPGNVREIEAAIQRAIIASPGSVLHGSGEAADEQADSVTPSASRPSIQDLRTAEREHIRSVLDACRWKIAGSDGAAARLGLPPSTLRSRMKKMGLDRMSAGTSA